MEKRRLNLMGALFLTLLIQLPAQGTDWDGIEYEVTELGHGIYALAARGGTIGLSVGKDGAFLIDDQFAPLTPKLLRAIQGVTDQPVKYVINTHWHGDHTGGNANLAAAGAVVVAHDNVRTRMAAPGPKQSAVEALPVITFSDSTSYYLNGHKIHAFHVGQAHTDGDVIIHFEDLNIIHAGDILFNGLYPYIDLDSGGSVAGYIAGMERILDLSDRETKIIAGHGPVGSRTDIERSLGMLQDARKRVADLVHQGLTLEEVQQADPLSDYHDDYSWSFITGERMTEILYNDLNSGAALNAQ